MNQIFNPNFDLFSSGLVIFFFSSVGCVEAFGTVYKHFIQISICCQIIMWSAEVGL